MGDNVGFLMGGMQPRPVSRPVATDDELSKIPIYQVALSRYVRALVDAYGWRPDVVGTNRVPWIPQPFAEEMLRYFYAVADEWLDRKDIPDEEKVPQLITHQRDEAVKQFGSLQFGSLAPEAANFQEAPPGVASKAPRLFPDSIAAGLPHKLALRDEPSFWFIYRLDKLATHLDGLRGVKKKIELLGEEFQEFDRRLTERVKGGIEGGLNALVRLPNEVIIKPIQRGLGIMTMAAMGLAILYVVTRK